MPIIFEKPIGSHADTKELEYIAALHQTGPKIRRDGSVNAEDVVRFLASRHGIKVDTDFAKKQLMPGLAGSMVDGEEAVFDIAELASILMISYLRKIGESNNCEKNFGEVLNIILTDVNGSTKPCVLDRRMLIQILNKYGEGDIDPAVIDEMLHAAGITDGKDRQFDYNVLVEATTGDIQQIRNEWEGSRSTHYNDVLDGTTLDAYLGDNDSDEETAECKFDHDKGEVQRIFTAPTIDMIAENFRSKTFVAILLILVLLTFYNYAFDYKAEWAVQDCDTFPGSQFSCDVVNSLIIWLLIFLQLSVFFSTFFILTSAGNSVYLDHDILSLCSTLVGIASVFVFTVLPYFLDVNLALVNTNHRWREDQALRSGDEFMRIFGIVLGVVLIFFQLKSLLFVIIPKKRWPQLAFTEFFLTSEMCNAERDTKRAAAYKIEKMVENALLTHEGHFTKKHDVGGRQKSRSNALLNFQGTADHRERTIGVFPIFRKIADGSIYYEDGVWIHSRLYAMNVIQWVVTLFYILVGIVLPTIVTDHQFLEEIEKYIKVSEGQLIAASICGGIAAVLTSGGLATIWLPSSISTIQKFRCGAIESLYNKDFQRYRVAPDLTTLLYGATFFGAWTSSFCIYLVVGGLIFLLSWEIFQPILLELLALLVGFLIPLIVKMLFLIFVRKRLFDGFFRSRPAGGNLLLLIFECWALGLTVLSILIRLVKLAIVAVFYVGRIDTPLFAPGAGSIFCIQLDTFPIQFEKDLLLHDAHRHPYMERLGVMYMMKIRYGKDFANRAGSTWRLVFTLALMPWLQRYRLHDKITSDNEEEAKQIAQKPTDQDQIDTQKLMTYVKELEKIVGEDKKTRLRNEMNISSSCLSEEKDQGEKKDDEEIKSKEQTVSSQKASR